MTEEMYNDIVAHIADEVEDVERYRELHERADGYAKMVLGSIVRDEESHARYLADVLKSAGRDMPRDLWERYSTMESEFRAAHSNR